MKLVKSNAGIAQANQEWTQASELVSSPYIRTVYVYGPPGIGKTYLAFKVGRIAAGVFPVTLTPETPASELMGHFMPHGHELVWHDGPFALAMRAGGRLVINELTHASHDVLAILYPVLESCETAQLMLPTGEILKPAEGFNVVATDNEAPECLPEALQDRFESVISLTRPHPDMLAALHPGLREAAERSFTLDEERRISSRRWMTISRLAAEMGTEKACNAVLGCVRGKQLYEAIILAKGAVGLT